MKKKRFKATTVLSLIAVLACLCVGGVTVMFKGFVDFPCFVYYDETNKCMMAGGEYPEIDEEKHIQVFLDVMRLGFSGAGCNAKSSSTDLLELDIPATPLKFERQDDVLFVNGKRLETGEQFVFTNYWALNPWTVEKVEFTNYGSVPVCESSQPPQIYVKGSYWNQISLLKPALLLAFCFLVIYGVVGWKKRKDVA